MATGVDSNPLDRCKECGLEMLVRKGTKIKCLNCSWEMVWEIWQLAKNDYAHFEQLNRRDWITIANRSNRMSGIIPNLENYERYSNSLIRSQPLDVYALSRQVDRLLEAISKEKKSEMKSLKYYQREARGEQHFRNEIKQIDHSDKIEVDQAESRARRLRVIAAEAKLLEALDILCTEDPAPNNAGS